MRVERLTPVQPGKCFAEIARLHIAAIHHGLLPLLGPQFLARLYFELARSARSAVWIAREDDKVVGYLAGCVDVRRCLCSVFVHGAFPLAKLAIGALLSLRTIAKMPALFLYPFRQSSSDRAPHNRKLAHAELLAVAVDDHFRGKGMGKMLVAALEEALISWGVSSYIVTTNAADKRSNQFYQSLGFKPCGTMPHHHLILQRYQKQIHHTPDDKSAY